jgi:hypothetical protein
MLQMVPQMPIFITARHVLRGFSNTEITTALGSSGLQYRAEHNPCPETPWWFFEILDHNGRPMDVIVVMQPRDSFDVPRKGEARPMRWDRPASLGFREDFVLAALLDLTSFSAHQIAAGDDYKFVQFGGDGVYPNQKEMTGKLAAVAHPHIWLSAQKGRIHYKGTSGGFLYSSNPERRRQWGDADWKPRGILVCHHSTDTGASYLAAFSILGLSRANIREVSPDVFINDPMPGGLCRPIDRRDAGG